MANLKGPASIVAELRVERTSLANRVKRGRSNVNLRRRAFALTTLILMFSVPGVFRTQELCGHNCVGSVFSGTLGFDPEDSSSRLSLVVRDNPRKCAAQSSNGEPLGTRSAAAEN
jgi:hypothetical protein